MQLSFDRLLTGHRDRRVTFVPPTQTVDPKRYRVAPLTAADAKAFVLQHHYSGSVPPIIHAYGLFRDDIDLCGVAIISWPTNQATTRKWAGLEPGQALELGRFVLLDSEAFNAETMFLADVRRQLHATAPDLQALLAFSDPVPRARRGQPPSFRGHFGQIYQALNHSIYLGRSSARRLTLTRDGFTISDRSIAKISQSPSCDHHSADGAYLHRRLLALGAEPINPRETGSEYLSRLVDSQVLFQTRHPGCHAYLLPMGRRRQRQMLRDHHDRGLGRPRVTDPPIVLPI